jgi:L-threonine kinase
MASSSADMVAAARAIGDAYGFIPEPAEIEDLIRAIEPTDGVMYDECVAFSHRDVRLHTRLGPLPPLTVVGLDEGGAVDTITFNRLHKSYTAQERDEYAALLHAARAAIRADDTETLGRLASRSAVMNQRLRPKRMLGAALEISRRTGALGVAVAHSGTKLGVLLADSDPDYQFKLGRVLEACHEICGQISVDYTLPRAWSQAIPARKP